MTLVSRNIRHMWIFARVGLSMTAIFGNDVKQRKTNSNDQHFE